jgi:hypothetical protein
MAKPAVIKTKETDANVEEFIATVKEEQRREDCRELVKLMEKVSNSKAKMWGSAIIGFGNLRYKSPKTGREVDWFKIGFSPRKTSFSLYLLTDMKALSDQFKKLGKHKMEGGCLHIKKLEEVDKKVLASILSQACKKNRQ